MTESAEPPEPGVYVARALLEQLERDKRGLKWQLARATKDAEARASQLAACEAKVKDLMTIVEMNKSVADRAVQRNYSKECVLQRLHKERVALQTRVESQRVRSLEAMQRRRAVMRMRLAFTAWRNGVEQDKQRRRAIRALMRERRRKWLQQSWSRWKGVAAQTGAVVHPMPGRIEQCVLKPSRRVQFDFSPSSSQSSDSSKHTHTTLSFATWKAQWLTRQRQHKTAMHFARLLLAKRTLGAWKQLIRLRNWRHAMIATARQRRRYRCFCVWASWTKRRRQVRALLLKLTRRWRHWNIQNAFTRLRVRCLERCLVDWGDVLKDARSAMDEERKIYALHQNQALEAIHRDAEQQQEQQRRFVAMQLEMMEKTRHHDVLRRYVAQWRRRLAFRGMQARVAEQFCRFRKHHALKRRILVRWRRAARHARSVQIFRQTQTAHRSRWLMATAFWAFARRVQRQARQKRAWRRALSMRKTQVLMRAMWKWKSSSVSENQRATAHLQQRELTQRLEVREATWLGEAQRLRRVTYRYQLQCALSMGDWRRERFKRVVFGAWRARVAAVRKKQRAVCRLVRKKAEGAVKLALMCWSEKTQDRGFVHESIEDMKTRRESQLQRRVLRQWRAETYRQWKAATQQRVALIVLLVWRKKARERRARSAAIRVMLATRVRYCWQRPAFDKWKQKSETAKLMERRRRERREELLLRVWRRWTMSTSRKTRRRRLQSALIAEKAEERASRRLVMAVWTAWRGQVRRRRMFEAHQALVKAREAQSHRQILLGSVWRAWHRVAKVQVNRRRGLQSALDTRQRLLMRRRWERWRALVDVSLGMEAGGVLARRKMRAIVEQHRAQRLKRRCFDAWRRRAAQSKQRRQAAMQWTRRRHMVIVRACLVQWRSNYLAVIRLRRVFLRGCLIRRRIVLLRLALQRWHRVWGVIKGASTLQQASSRQSQTQERALRWLRKAWMTRGLRACFIAWARYRDLSVRQKVFLHKALRRAVTKRAAHAWAKWRRSAKEAAAIATISTLARRGVVRQAWRLLLRSTEQHRVQALAVSRLVRVAARVTTRCTWIQWKRRDREMLLARLSVKEVSSSAALDAFLHRLGSRHFAKSTLSRVFLQWRGLTQHQRSLRLRVMAALAKQDALSTRRCFSAWRSWLDQQALGRGVLLRLLNRRAAGLQRESLARWRSYTVESSYRVRLLETQRQLHQHREALARHVAMTLLHTITKPTLATALSAWKDAVGERKRREADGVRLWQSRTQRSAWNAWKYESERSKRAKRAVAKLLLSRQRQVVARAWELWTSRVCHQAARVSTLHRLMQVVYLRLLRVAWKALQRNQDLVMRRQSMMAVVAAQQKLQQQKELHRMRSITFLMQRRQKSIVRVLFMMWASYGSTRRQCRAMSQSVRRRHARRSLRATLHWWRRVVEERLATQRRVDKWRRVVCAPRRMQSAWQSWLALVARRCEARSALLLFERRRQRDALVDAWDQWQGLVVDMKRLEGETVVEQWRCATVAQQSRVASLESKTELLLLESVELKRAMQTQKRKCVDALVRRVWAVMTAAWLRRVKERWTQWSSVVRRVRAAQWIARKRAALRMKEAISMWKREAHSSKWTVHETRVMERMAMILATSTTQTLRKRVWGAWKAYAVRRRAKRRQRAALDMMRRRHGDARTLRCVLLGWKALTRESAARHAITHERFREAQLRVLRTCMAQWQQQSQATRTRRNAALLLLRAVRSQRHRVLICHWLKWRGHAMEAAVVMARAKAVMMEFEDMEKAERQGENATMIRVLTAWRARLRQREVCEDRAIALMRLSCKRNIVRRLLRAWQEVAAQRRRQKKARQQPVLCIRSPLLTTSKKNATTSSLCSYAEYAQHRCRLQWRLQLTPRVAVTQWRRSLATVLLVRSLRRQHHRVVRCALWRWFARIQRISTALHAVDFAMLPWSRTGVDYAGTMLLLALEEMDLRQQLAHAELVQRAWRVVDAIAVAHRRQALRRALDKWRWTPRFSSSYRPPALARHDLVRARAFATQLWRVLLRRAFSSWKAEFVARAMQQAEAAHAALLEALARTQAHRQALHSLSA